VAPTSAEPGTRVLILGGIRSGKSVVAEQIIAELACGIPVRYLATGTGNDEEWERRVAAHRLRRTHGWITVESTDVAGILTDDTVPTLVDDLGGWLTSIYDQRGWCGSVEPEIDALATAVDGHRGAVVLVSSEVGLTLVPTTASGRLFSDALGTVNQRLAAVCDRVLLVVAGIPVEIKGSAAAKGLR
jgi:adenosylcobinamide kinase/adenosylcobinamide-phosphate guanylyltransferase